MSLAHHRSHLPRILSVAPGQLLAQALRLALALSVIAAVTIAVVGLRFVIWMPSFIQ